MDRQLTMAGLDVQKDSIYLCVTGHCFPENVRDFGPVLHRMCADMVSHRVTEAAVKSTATYCVPVWNALCESMSSKLVNPFFIKQRPVARHDHHQRSDRPVRIDQTRSWENRQQTL